MVEEEKKRREEEDEVIAKDGELHSGGRDLTPEARLCLGHISTVHFIQTVWVRMRGQGASHSSGHLGAKEAFRSCSYESSRALHIFHLTKFGLVPSTHE